jgi:hypothetical protein
MPARTRNLNVVVGADTKPFQRGIKDADRSLDKFSRNATARSKATAAGIRGLGLAATGATVGVVGLVGVGKQLVDAYSESEKSQAKLQAQLKATGVSYAAHRKEIDKAVTATSRLAAVDDEDLQDAFTSLVRSSGKVGQSMKDLTLVTDLSRAKNLDLTKSADLIGKVHAGNIGVLKRYGIAIDPVTTAQDRLKASTSKATDEQKRAAKAADTAATSTKAIGELQKRFAGQAEAYGKTNAGAVDRFKVAFQNLEETAGKALAPTLTNLATKASKFVEQMQDGTGQGGRFVDKLKDIRDQIEPVAKWLFNAGKNVARFAQDHPNVTKLAVAVAAVGSAIKLIRFAGAISGFSAFLSAGKTAATGLRKIMSTAGTQAGEAAAANAAEGMANQMGPSLNSRKGKFAAAGRGVGGVLGAAVGVAAIAGIGLALTSYLTKLNDQLEKKGGLAGLIGKVSNIGEDLANLTPQTRGIIPAAQAIFGGGNSRSRSTPNRSTSIGRRPHGAGGGRVYGPVKGADSVPAVLSPDEFVVTGGGEQMLESMTFPGVLNWLEGAQPSHFQGGGRAGYRDAGLQPGTSGHIGSRISGIQAAAAARAAGFSGEALAHILAISTRESTLYPGAYNTKGRDWSIGMTQVNQLAHNGRFGTDRQLMDPVRNYRAAWSLSNHGSVWSPWSTNKGLSSAAMELGRRYAAGSRGVAVPGGPGSSGGGGGTTTTSRTPLGGGDAIYAGFAAAQEGTSLRSFLGAALENVGVKSTSATAATTGTTRRGSSGGATPTARAGTQIVDGKPVANWIVPYLKWAKGHGWTGTVTSGYRTLADQTRIYNSGVRPAAKPGTSNHEGDAFPRGAVDVSNASQLASVLAGYPGGSKLKWAGAKDPVHFSYPHGGSYRRGGRVRAFAAGGWASRRGRSMGSTRRGRRPANAASIAPYLSSIVSGSAGAVQGTLRKAQTFMAANGNVSNLTAWIAAARRRSSGRGISATARQGLQSFVALAEARARQATREPHHSGGHRGGPVRPVQHGPSERTHREPRRRRRDGRGAGGAVARRSCSSCTRIARSRSLRS